VAQGCGKNVANRANLPKYGVETTQNWWENYWGNEKAQREEKGDEEATLKMAK
jgi:hypothetical protein